MKSTPSSKLQAPIRESVSLKHVAVFIAAFSTLNLLFRSHHFVLNQLHALFSRITSRNVTSNFLNGLNPIRSDAWFGVVSECSKFASGLRFCSHPLAFCQWQPRSSNGVSGSRSPLFLLAFLRE